MLVDEHGHRKWSFIANKMEGRRGKQCRDRWLNHLKPDIRRGEWTAEEERILVEGHRMLGTRWAALAKLLPGRPENAIKNHWHATLRCKWAQRGGRISELQAYQHSLNLTNGGGGPATAAQKAAAAARRREPVPHRGGVRRRRRGGGGGGGDQEQGHAGERLRVRRRRRPRRPAAAAAAVVGRRRWASGRRRCRGRQARHLARALENIGAEVPRPRFPQRR